MSRRRLRGPAAIARIAAVTLLAMSASACQPTRPAPGCSIEGPDDLVPSQVLGIRLGMSHAELEALLGPPDYSPAEGQYYFSTGGDCPLGSEGQVASCGVVASFAASDDGDGAKGSGSLAGCWWGAIGE